MIHVVKDWESCLLLGKGLERRWGSEDRRKDKTIGAVGTL